MIVAGYYGFTLDVRVSVSRPFVHFSFPDDNLSKHQWIFTKLGMCIDIVEIWFGIANGQILSIFYGVICPRHAHIFISMCLSVVRIFTKLGMCIDIVEIWFGIVKGQISSNFCRVICPRHAHVFIFWTIT